MRKCSRVMLFLLALILLVFSFAGCGTKTADVTDQGTQKVTTEKKAEATQEALKPVTLKLYFPGEKKSATDEVWEKISEQYKDKLNASFEVNFIAFNDYTDKMTLLAASGDEYDMNFDGSWLSYPKMVNKGAYLDLKDLMPKYAPATYESLQKSGALAAATVNGQLLAIPWEMSMNQQRSFFRWRKDVAEELGINVPKDSIKTIEDLDAFLTSAQKVLPADMKVFGWDAGDTSNVQSALLSRDEMNILDFHTFSIAISDDKGTIVPIEQTKAFLDAATYTKKWFDAGIVPRNLMVEKEQMSSAYRNGTLFSAISTHEWANADQGFADTAWTQESSELYPDKKSVNRSPLANITCINRNAANPERALMLVELLTTDGPFYDLALYGIEGQTYVVNSIGGADYPEGITQTNSTYLDWPGQWAWWKPQFMRPTLTYGQGFWENEATFAAQPNNSTSLLDGLFFDTETIKNEIAKRDQILAEQGKLIQYGVIKDDVATAVNDYIELQKNAGLDKIIAELTSQIEAFLGN